MEKDLVWSKEYGYHFEDLIKKSYAHVYLIRIMDTTYFKIGYTTNLKSRINSYRLASPFHHYYVAVFSCCLKNRTHNEHVCKFGERALLNKYKDCKIRGEWIKAESSLQIMCDLLNLDSDINEHPNYSNFMQVDNGRGGTYTYVQSNYIYCPSNFPEFTPDQFDEEFDEMKQKYA